MIRKFDFLVIGSGIAGMSFALKVAHKGSVALICKAGLEEANTYFAQGGIASVTNLKVDNFEKHIHDTMVAGDWISDHAAVEKVVRNAPAQIEQLIKWGVNFDKNEKGEFDLHREGGHSEFRILHHKDNTGAEIQTSLIEEVKSHPNITIFSNIIIRGSWSVNDIYDTWFLYDSSKKKPANDIINSILSLTNDKIYNTIHFNANRIYWYEMPYKGDSALGDKVRPMYAKLNSPEYSFLNDSLW